MASTLSAGLQGCCNHSARSVTHVAIGMDGARAIGAAQVLVSSLVFVRMVPNVHARRALLMRAVRRRRGPEGLQREQHEQENGEPAAHRRGL